MKRILLYEPRYKNKYPPLGLMKLSSYHKTLGDEVIFVKGNIKEVYLKQLSVYLVDRFTKIENDIIPETILDNVFYYLKTGRTIYLEAIENNVGFFFPTIESWLRKAFRDARKNKIIDDLKWDRIYVTTLFTFYWDITISSIKELKPYIKNSSNMFVGGVMASVLSEEIENITGVQVVNGLLTDSKRIGLTTNDNIDLVTPDYSILHQISYTYPEWDSYITYATRGCIRKCKFCAVPIIEPDYVSYIDIKKTVKEIDSKYYIRRKLLLLDNNVLASPFFKDIINDIIEVGFFRGAKLKQKTKLYSFYLLLKKGTNSFEYSVALWKEILNFVKQLNLSNKKIASDILDKYFKTDNFVPNSFSLIQCFEELDRNFDIRKITYKKRTVDFNQGIDSRLCNEENMRLLSKIAIQPLRIAFDHWSLRDIYINAIRLSAKYKIRNLSNYLLYNFEDKPEDLWNRLELNIKLCEEFDLIIYSFPMRYSPINDEQKLYQTRKYIGKNWNRKYIRAIQLILNSTKGKVGRNRSFFERAFGKNISEFFEILHMPDSYILLRDIAEKEGLTDNWRSLYREIKEEDPEIIGYIENYDLSLIPDKILITYKDFFNHYYCKYDDLLSIKLNEGRYRKSS